MAVGATAAATRLDELNEAEPADGSTALLLVETLEEQEPRQRREVQGRQREEQCFRVRQRAAREEGAG